ncbi:heterodisulfide reductase-related iron-sulfur binding cluster [Sediminicoccus sp. BL-A-41-H5]|uniref:heterodisulfide reductase-related iron-sulfur binding cluster n=1 Tax=Sediminicoccus sp. BL-A-41-H5 TaxID=3421106 RepID=UPI003D676436
MAVSTFWYGCNMTRHGEIIRLSQRILEAVGVEAAPVGGPGACCGSPKESTPRIAEGMADRTMEKFAASGTPRVITWCPSCHANLDDFMGQTKEQGFDSQHLCEAIHEQRAALAPLLTQRVAARVFVDRHVGFQGRVPVNDIIPELLGMIPGVSVADHPYRAPSYMCFGLASVPGALADVQRTTLAAMRETGADTLVTIFHSCHREMIGLERDHGIRVVNWVHLLAEGMGLPYEDEYKAWRNAPDPIAAIGPERVAAAGEVAVRKLVEPELTRPRLV